VRVDKTLKDSLEASLLKIHSDYSRMANDAHGQVEIYLRCRPSLVGVNRNSVADALCISARTLSRKLQAEGSCFRQLLTDERVRRCNNYMAAGICSGGEISRLLGFEDSSHFYRAFRRWTSISFSTAKQQLAEPNKRTSTPGG
jgi:AraC-like DNA-binding protein